MPISTSGVSFFRSGRLAVEWWWPSHRRKLTQSTAQNSSEQPAAIAGSQLCQSFRLGKSHEQHGPKPRLPLTQQRIQPIQQHSLGQQHCDKQQQQQVCSKQQPYCKQQHSSEQHGQQQQQQQHCVEQQQQQPQTQSTHHGVSIPPGAIRRYSINLRPTPTCSSPNITTSYHNNLLQLSSSSAVLRTPTNESISHASQSATHAPVKCLTVQKRKQTRRGQKRSAEKNLPLVGLGTNAAGLKQKMYSLGQTKK